MRAERLAPLLLLAAACGSSKDAPVARGSGSAVVHATAPADAVPSPDAATGVAHSLDELVAAFERQIQTPCTTAYRLSGLFAHDAVGSGTHQGPLAIGDVAVERALDDGIGCISSMSPAFKRWIGRAGDSAWIAETIDLKVRALELTFVATKQADGTWRFRAAQIAEPMGNDRAFQMLQQGTLPAPAPIANVSPSVGPAEDLVRAAFGKRAAYVDAFSTRSDAFAFGSAPGELMAGGTKVRGAFSRMKAELALHDGLRAFVDGDIAWTFANVDFMNRNGLETFRVLAVLLREGDRWTIVQAQWSNPVERD